jgi:hypothetical protein
MGDSFHSWGMLANSMRLKSCVTLSLAFALTSSCTRVIPPAPAPAAPSAPRPAVTPAPAPMKLNWKDAELTPGGWTYQIEGNRSAARFGADQLVLRCNREAGEITLSRLGSAEGPVPITILTSSTARTLNADPIPGTTPVLTLSLKARDSLLDALAFSRGRFAVEVAGLPTLIMPSWSEVSKVVEDCR